MGDAQWPISQLRLYVDRNLEGRRPTADAAVRTLGSQLFGPRYEFGLEQGTGIFPESVAATFPQANVRGAYLAFTKLSAQKPPDLPGQHRLGGAHGRQRGDLTGAVHQCDRGDAGKGEEQGTEESHVPLIGGGRASLEAVPIRPRADVHPERGAQGDRALHLGPHQYAQVLQLVWQSLQDEFVVDL